MKDIKVLFLLAIFFGNVFNPTCAFCLDGEELKLLQEQANTFYREANSVLTSDSEKARELYDKSLRRFKRIHEEAGVENGKLYYNIGNVYFRKGDVGRAILNYKRALDFSPADENLQDNLEYARSQREDKIETTSSTKILSTVLFWHYDLSAMLRSKLFMIVFTIFWLLLSVRLFWSSYVPFPTVVMSAVLSVALAASLSWDYLNQSPSAVIVADEIVARKGDGESFQPAFKEPLHSGTEVTVLEKRAGWMHVSLSDGRTCWIPMKSLEVV